MRSFAVLLPLAFALPGYKQIAVHHGVTVLQREGSQVIELAAEGDFAAPVDQVWRVMLDYERHPGFLKNVAESRIVQRGQNELWVYQRLALPVIADRDVTMHVKWGEDGPSRWIEFYADNAHGPAPRKGIVRLPVDVGGWRFDPIDGGRGTRARHWLRMDLAGALPKWLGRGHVGTDVPELFESFRKQICK